MRSRERGFTLVEVLISAAVLGIILSFVGIYMAQQARVTALSQAINEAEVLARAVAEVVLQDLQNAGARAVFVDGPAPTVEFASEPLDPNYCRDVDRSGCVVVGFAGIDEADGSYAAPRAPVVGEPVNAMTILYRSSLEAESSSCRRVDIAWLTQADGRLLLLRSDVPCESAYQPHVFAEHVTDVGLRFVCSSRGEDDEEPSVEDNPADCYTDGDDSRYVRQAEVSVTVTLDRRDTVVSDVTLTATTPNLRPRIDFLRDLDLVSDNDDGGP